MKIAMPRLDEAVAPCFEYTATIMIYTVERGTVREAREFPLRSTHALDRARLLKDQGVDVLICGGVSVPFEHLVKANGIEVVSWVSGRVDDLLQAFLRGTLTAGSGRLCPTDGSTTLRGEEAADT